MPIRLVTEYSVEDAGGQDRSLVWGEADSTRRFELYVSDDLAGVGLRGEDGAWSVTDAGWLGFPRMALPAALNEDAAATAAVDALSDWIDEHRRDLWRDV